MTDAIDNVFYVITPSEICTTEHSLTENGKISGENLPVFKPERVSSKGGCVSQDFAGHLRALLL